MNIQEIQDLIKFVSKMQVTEVEIEKKDFKLIIKSELKNRVAEQQPIVVQAGAPVAIPAAPATPAPAPAAPATPAAPAAAESNLLTIKSTKWMQKAK